MPSFSKALKKINGQLFPFGFFHILRARYFNNRASFYLIGVRPDYQNKGITAIIFNEMQKTFNKHGVTIVETNPELVENSAIQSYGVTTNTGSTKEELLLPNLFDKANS